jgi:predicted  nucleic acid-binding Zn-ribbon protein
LEKLRIESEEATTRAEKAEADVKSLNEQLAKQETNVQNLNNKVKLLQGDLERSEQRAEQNKASKLENDKDGDVKDSLKRKVQMLEKQLEDKEVERKDAVEKYVNYSVRNI